MFNIAITLHHLLSPQFLLYLSLGDNHLILIPPDDIIQLVIDINKTFTEAATENYILDAKTCIPHISLLMGLMTRKQVPEVSRRLQILAENFSALKLKITSVKTPARPDGKVLSVLEIEKTPELQKLHETILDEINSVFTYEGVDKEMFYTPPPVNKVPMSWVQGFVQTSVRENYKPHITLGVGEPRQKITPVHFTASQLALCHLGNHNTCRDILWSASLS